MGVFGMNLLDMRTVILSYAISNFICMILMAILWQQNRRKFAGLGFWLADFALQFLALVLLPLRGSVPEFLATTVSNAMVIAGAILLYIGLEQFTGKRSLQIHNFLLLAVFIIVHAYFVFIFPSLAARSVLISAGLLIICFQCAWLMLRRAGPELRPTTRGVGYVFVAFCLLSLIRIAVDVEIPLGNDFFRSNVYETSLLITYQMLIIVLTLSLFLMVNRRLFEDLENDITARKRAEEIIRLRLRLWEFAARNPVARLMQMALDEIEVLTGSLIGFYHFVDEDQNSLALQAWSTRTQAEFCKAEGEGLHYPIDQAGVWVDCVRERRPVIHNDYASLKHRKGMPAGHADVVRELVVPTMRDGKIVAILGIGNKKTDYDQQDVEQVSHIAEIVWSIVEYHRAAEQIRVLNGQLEHLAMTDDLTGLANRRSFFIRGGEEIKRARRYQVPLSLIMLDIDGFKNINDSYGHETGDLVLQRIANTLLKNIRAVDAVARLGGEEFSVLLPSTQSEDAVKLAERLRLAVEAESFEIREQQRMSVTASIGVAAYGDDTPDLDALLRNADAAMYQAKNQGRNRLILYT
jgi:diguanylate cyclase (GGDEF)-like protein